jgi:plasmid stability protein
MGQILVRQIDDEIIEALRARAKANNRSTEAEIRTILRDSLRPAEPRQPSLVSLVGAGRGSMAEDEIAEHVRQLREEWGR